MASNHLANNDDVIENSKFDFFKKRRRNAHTHDHSDSSMIFNKLASNSNHNFHNIFQGSSSNSDFNRSSRRKSIVSQQSSSFKGFIKDLQKIDISQASTSQYNNDSACMIDDDPSFLNPPMPNIDYRKCISFFYISWIRDQLLYGNHKISISKIHEKIVENILHSQKVKIESFKNSPGINNNTAEILCLLYSRFMSIYKSYLNIIREPLSLNRFYIFSATSGVYIRIVNIPNLEISSLCDYDNIDLGNLSQLDDENLTQDVLIANFLKDKSNSTGTQSQTNENKFYIGEHYIEGPTFIQSSNLSLLKTMPIEFLPLKMGKEFLGDWSDTCYLNEAVSQSLWERATKELIIVKALVNVPSIPLAQFEGFDISNINAGERFWVPLYIAKRLCYLGIVHIEVPIWLLPDFLKDFYEKENSSSESLMKFPSDYFYEIAHVFMARSLIKRICFPPSLTKLSEQTFFSIISKASGYIEDIKNCRESKIRKFISSLKSRDFFTIQNLQLSETYILSQFLGAYWPPINIYKSESIKNHWEQHTKKITEELKNIIAQNS